MLANVKNWIEQLIPDKRARVLDGLTREGVRLGRHHDDEKTALFRDSVVTGRDIQRTIATTTVFRGTGMRGQPPARRVVRRPRGGASLRGRGAPVTVVHHPPPPGPPPPDTHITTTTTTTGTTYTKGYYEAQNAYRTNVQRSTSLNLRPQPGFQTYNPVSYRLNRDPAPHHGSGGGFNIRMWPYNTDTYTKSADQLTVRSPEQSYSLFYLQAANGFLNPYTLMPYQPYTRPDTSRSGDYAYDSMTTTFRDMNIEVYRTLSVR
jgi:hypothetical protein